MEPVKEVYRLRKNINDDYISNVEEIKHQKVLKKYDDLLLAIAKGFGFSNSEAMAVADSAYAQNKSGHSDLPWLIWLCRSVVRRCVYIKSNEMFSHSTGSTGRGYVCIYPYTMANLYKHVVPIKEMPLSYGTVFLLRGVLKFSEVETAAILNTSIFLVRERFLRALDYIGS